MRLKEKEIVDELFKIEDALYPLMIKQVDKEPSMAPISGIDALIKFSVQDGPVFEAAVAILSISTPKVISEKSKLFRNLELEIENRKIIPLLIAPYIDKKQSKMLLNEGISWIDLSGNMVINVKPTIYIERKGNPNKFPDTSPIKKIYEGTSSLVGRALLLKPEGFSSLYKIVDFINSKNASITTATVSKVLKSLEDELIISKSESTIRVKNPEALLKNLADGYSDYSKRIRNRYYKYDVKDIDVLTSILYESEVDYTFCGFYAAKLKGLGITDQVSISIKSIQDIKKTVQQNTNIASPDEEYGQVTFIETKNQAVFFNIQNEPFNYTIDDIELYIELINDRPRGPKIANQLKEEILGKFN